MMIKTFQHEHFSEAFDMLEEVMMDDEVGLHNANVGWLAMKKLAAAGATNPSQLLAALFSCVPAEKLVGHFSKETVFLIKQTQIYAGGDGASGSAPWPIAPVTVDLETASTLSVDWLHDLMALGMAMAQSISVIHDMDEDDPIPLEAYTRQTVADLLNSAMDREYRRTLARMENDKLAAQKKEAVR